MICWSCSRPPLANTRCECKLIRPNTRQPDASNRDRLGMTWVATRRKGREQVEAIPNTARALMLLLHKTRGPGCLSLFLGIRLIITLRTGPFPVHCPPCPCTWDRRGNELAITNMCNTTPGYRFLSRPGANIWTNFSLLCLMSQKPASAQPSRDPCSLYSWEVGRGLHREAGSDFLDVAEPDEKVRYEQTRLRRARAGDAKGGVELASDEGGKAARAKE